MLGSGKSKVVQMVWTVVIATHARRARSDADVKQTTRHAAGASRASLQQAWIRPGETTCKTTVRSCLVQALFPSERCVAAIYFLSKCLCAFCVQICQLFRFFASVIAQLFHDALCNTKFARASRANDAVVVYVAPLDKTSCDWCVTRGTKPVVRFSRRARFLS